MFKKSYVRAGVAAVLTACLASMGGAEEFTFIIGPSSGSYTEMSWEIDPSTSYDATDMSCSLDGTFYCDDGAVASFSVSVDAYDYFGQFTAEGSSNDSSFNPDGNWGGAYWDDLSSGYYTVDVNSSLQAWDSGYSLSKGTTSFDEWTNYWTVHCSVDSW